MSTPVKFDDLLAVCEWVSTGETLAMGCAAYIGRASGTIHWCGDGIDEEPPEDIDDGTLYIAVPHKSEFELGAGLGQLLVALPGKVLA